MNVNEISKYIIDNPTILTNYTPLIDAKLLASIIQGDRSSVRSYFSQEYAVTKEIYLSTGNPAIAIRYAYHSCRLAKDVSVWDIEIAVFLAYAAELWIACGDVSPYVDKLLDLAEKHASKAPCRNDARIHSLANIYLLRSISEKALGNPVEAFKVLSTVSKNNWIMKNGSIRLLMPIDRQKVMMRQSLQGYIELLYSAQAIKYDDPLEYYRSMKRVFEFATNNGLHKSVKKLMPDLLKSFSVINQAVPPISKVSLLKNLGQANALLNNFPLAKIQLRAALKAAEGKKLSGQITQIHQLIDAVDQENVVGALATFRVRQ